jgi:type II secretory pathway component PulF
MRIRGPVEVFDQIQSALPSFPKGFRDNAEAIGMWILVACAALVIGVLLWVAAKGNADAFIEKIDTHKEEEE